MSINISKVTTKFGDQGKTSLSCGTVVPKDHVRVQFFGKLDSLNCILGSLRTELDLLDSQAQEQLDHPQFLIEVQNDIFDLGASYSFEQESQWQKEFPAQRTEALEAYMSQWLPQLEDLKSFVLPGGTRANSFAHQGRSCSREIESWSMTHREALQLQSSGITYLNRISDALFVYSRLISKVQDTPEYLWQAGLK